MANLAVVGSQRLLDRIEASAGIDSSSGARLQEYIIGGAEGDESRPAPVPECVSWRQWHKVPAGRCDFWWACVNAAPRNRRRQIASWCGTYGLSTYFFGGASWRATSGRHRCLFRVSSWRQRGFAYSYAAQVLLEIVQQSDTGCDDQIVVRSWTISDGGIGDDYITRSRQPVSDCDDCCQICDCRRQRLRAFQLVRRGQSLFKKSHIDTAMRNTAATNAIFVLGRIIARMSFCRHRSGLHRCGTDGSRSIVLATTAGLLQLRTKLLLSPPYTDPGLLGHGIRPGQWPARHRSSAAQVND